MKISEMIRILQSIQAQHSDLPVWGFWEWAEPITDISYYPGNKTEKDVPESVMIGWKDEWNE